MTMPDPVAEVVERLRRDAYAPHFTSVGAANLMIEAADLIERLSRERDTGVPEGFWLAPVNLPRAAGDAMLEAMWPSDEIIFDDQFDGPEQQLSAGWDAVRSAAPQPPTVSEGWQDISTAPKGERVLLISDDGVFIGDWGNYCIYNSPKITHWIPLPAKPGEHLAPQPDLSTLTRERDQAREALAAEQSRSALLQEKLWSFLKDRRDDTSFAALTAKQDLDWAISERLNSHLPTLEEVQAAGPYGHRGLEGDP